MKVINKPLDVQDSDSSLACKTCSESGRDGEPRMIPLSPDEGRQILEQRRDNGCNLVRTTKAFDPETMKLREQAMENTFGRLRYALTNDNANASLTIKHDENQDDSLLENCSLTFSPPTAAKKLGKETIDLTLEFDPTGRLQTFAFEAPDASGTNHNLDSNQIPDREIRSKLIGKLTQLHRNAA